MEVQATQEKVARIESDAAVIGLYDAEDPCGAAAEIDDATAGLLKRLLDAKEIGTGCGDVTRLFAPSGVAANQIVCVGLGKRSALDANVAYRAAAAASHHLAAKQRGSIAFFLGDALGDDADGRARTEAAVAGSLVGCQGQDLYRSEKKRFPFETLLWATDDVTLRTGRILGESINVTRRLVDEPPDRIYPTSFADAAIEMAKPLALDVEVWDQARLEKERCGALLAVAQGSSQEPRLVIVRYRGAADDAPTLGLVGKGVTFDSGGLSLKPSDGMKTMKCDMAGAATVLGAMRAIAALELPVNVTAVLGLVENMTGSDAYRLGDVVTARNGTTIEIHNTDAEGRLVLADALDVAVELGVDRLLDLATLTGACVVALGENVTGLMTNNQAWCDTLMTAARRAGEPVWQLPMFDEFDEQIQSSVADIKNTGEGRWGGAMTAAKLLERFVGEVPWTHMDIAGPAFAEKPSAGHDGGATGAMVRTLVEVARGRATPMP